MKRTEQERMAADLSQAVNDLIDAWYGTGEDREERFTQALTVISSASGQIKGSLKFTRWYEATKKRLRRKYRKETA